MNTGGITIEKANGNTARALEHQTDKYYASLNLALDMSEEGKALIVAPDDILGMKTLTKDVEKLKSLYTADYCDAAKIKDFVKQ